jgi:serine/threonine protein kinase
MIGQSLGRYRILAKLGAGGMGEVWRAHDARLGRDVAIKVLPAEVATDPDRVARFTREARALATLSHPDILAIHEFGEDQGVTFAVTELLEGETLRARLTRGALPWRQAVEVAAAIADGLAAAHAAGIIHRDLKPENVVVRADGRVKVLDFGLAKTTPGPLTEGATATALPVTTAGTLLGTVGYMSPEQVRGEPADARSDLFALGCVLYELLTGRAPFARATPADTLAAVLAETPPELALPGVEAAPELQPILRRCLHPRPAQRFQSAADLAFALRAQTARPPAGMPAFEGGTPGPPADKSIVVLPFDNLSPDPENAFFADGLTEELIADLSKVRALRVISRTSAFAFRGTQRTVPAVARELNVRYAVEGSVRRAGTSLRITAQLIDASTDTHLWAEKYSGTLDDVFDLQERLSRRIVGALQVALAPGEDQRLGARPTSELRAYDAWLRAMYEARTCTPDGVARAVKIASETLAMVGEDPLIYAALAYAHYVSYDFGFQHDESALTSAEDAASRALALAPSLSQAVLSMGLVRYKRGDWLSFARHAKRAVELEQNADALSWWAFALMEAGREADARRIADDALARDPFSSWPTLARAWVDVLGDDYEACHQRIRTAVERLAANEPVVVWWLGQAAAFAGREDEALVWLERVEQMKAGAISRLGELFRRALQHDREGVHSLLDGTDIRQLARTDEYYPFYLAVCLVHIGDVDEALEWIERAVSWGFRAHRFYESNRYLAPLHGDPRFRALMKRAREEAAALDL